MNLWPFGRKALAAFAHAATWGAARFLSNFDLLHQGGTFDYARQVGDGTGASVLMAVVQWVQRSMPEAPLVIEKRKGDDWDVSPDHELERLLASPNIGYSGTHLWQATVFSYLIAGNAYWAIVRTGRGVPVELWYMPHRLVSPRAPQDGSKFISHYEYVPGGRTINLAPEDVVHFRHGLDPSNPRLGQSPVGSALREIWTDQEASEFIATLLRNAGIPGLVISPADKSVILSPEEARENKKYIMERTTGTHRGEPAVFTGPTKVERLAWSPQEMNLSPASDRSEERVCALLGIPAAVIGFSAGLEQTKVGATMTELRRLAWQNGIIPLQRNFADEITRCLAPDYGPVGTLRARFDTSQVAALAEDRNALVTRLGLGVAGGWIPVDEALRQVGIDPMPSDHVYLRSFAVVEVPVGQPQVPPSTGAEPPPEEDDTDDEAKALKESGLEQRLAASAPRATVTTARAAFISGQERAAAALRAKMEGALGKFFTDTLGKRAAEAAGAELGKALKQSPDDVLAVDRIIEAMAMREITPIFQRVYEAHYLLTLEQTRTALGALGLATDVPDPVARAVVATGGTRAGLVDLTAQTKAALYKALEEGRAMGEGAQALADRIAGQVAAGPWSSPEIRAMVIARTETKHAQRVSVLHSAAQQGVERFQVFDARLGDTDEICEALHGTIVTAAEAAQLAADEHPNGSRDFVPYWE